MAWVIVTGAATDLTRDEEATATLLGGLLAREGYGLIAGTWKGVDELVTRAFLRSCPPGEENVRVVHVVNNRLHSGHDIRVGRLIQSSASEEHSMEAVELADAGVIVSGREGSKPTMDALIRLGKPVVPLAWLGRDAFASLQDLLRQREGTTYREQRDLLLPLVDPASAADETLSRVLGAVTCRDHEVFVSYHRSDSGADAGRMARALSELYGSSRVFIDYDSLAVAEHVERVVEKAGRSRLFLVLIGPKFVSKVASGQDYVRREIEAARGGGSVILPVIVDRGVPRADELPDELRFLVERNALLLDRHHWDSNMRSISKAIDAALGVTRMRP